MITPDIVLEASGLAGRARTRAGDESDTIDGVRPRVVVDPDSRESLAALLAWASRERLAVVLRGSGTKLAWGCRPTAVDLLVGTRRLNRVIAHQHGDLTATMEAGVTMGELNRELARHGQWLPVDVSFEEATVGGTLAANDSGALRHRHGTPRDLLIGVRLATTDGRVVKAGGNVVKNVAGYDLGRLMCGSFGSLAAIVEATFKLAPLPASSATVLAGFREADAMARAVAAIASSQLEPVAFEVQATIGDAYHVLVRFASMPEAVEAQTDEARRLLAADRIDIVTDAAEADAWRRHRDAVWTAPGAAVKVSWLPASLVSVVALLQDVLRLGTTAVSLAGRASVGAGVVRVDADRATQAKAIDLLRARPDVVGNVVVLRADAEVKEQTSVWGASGDVERLWRALKVAFDPAGILNAGRGPVV